MWLSLVWGCQFDPETRKAWAAVTNLGLLLTIDYDTGDVLQSRFAGFGLRSMVVDRSRRRIYAANFLRGDVLVLDIDTGAEIERWFAGRFVRGLSLTRDGRSLLVGSNLGVLSIPLEKGPP
jgi:DNA-binding beta-propeller fold protein YncE